MNLSQYLGRNLSVIIDRPLGSKHPKHGFIYETNYGYLPDTKAPDGEEIDAYLLGVNKPVVEYNGICIAIIHRLDDEDDKLIITSKGIELSNDEIIKATHFQEKYFQSEITRK